MGTGPPWTERDADDPGRRRRRRARSAEVIAQLRTITNSQSEAVIALDMTARISFANPAALQLLGAREQSDVLGKPIQEQLILRHRRRQIDFPSMVARQVVAQDADATLGPRTVTPSTSPTPSRRCAPRAPSWAPSSCCAT